MDTTENSLNIIAIYLDRSNTLEQLKNTHNHTGDIVCRTSHISHTL